MVSPPMPCATSLAEAKLILAEWLEGYNSSHPHSSLGMLCRRLASRRPGGRRRGSGRRREGATGEEWDWGWDPDPLRWGADEYEVVVDIERGVLLRCASRLGGEDFDVLEVEEIHFDERFDDDTFSSRQPLPWGR